MEFISSFKDSLTQLNYPNISALDDIEVMEIFSDNNRIHFLEWVFEKMNLEYSLPLDSKKKEIMLGDVLWQHGLCVKSQRSGFVDSSMEFNIQLKIIQKIFVYLCELSTMVSSLSLDEDMDKQMEILEGFVLQDVNLFPAYGTVIHKSSKAMQESALALKRSINELKAETESVPVGADDFESEPLDIDMSSQIILLEKAVQNFQCNPLEELKLITSTKELNFELPSKIHSLARDANKSLLDTVQYMSTLKSISTMNVPDYPNKTEDTNELHVIINELFQKSWEIIELKKKEK